MNMNMNMGMNRKLIGSLILIFLIVVAAALFAAGKFDVKESVSGRAVSEGKTVSGKTESAKFDISNLMESEFVQDLPKNAVIELKLGENYYTVSKNSVTVGKPENPDLTISLPAKYMNDISAGLCETVKRANQNRELGMEIHASQTSLMWKYRGMLKYKDCLG